MWMNRFDVEEAVAFYASGVFPNAQQAALALHGLMEWTDDNSDGWPYWSKPSKASQALQVYLSEWRTRYIAGDDRDLSDADLKAALRPIKAFLTRHGADWREVLGW